MKSLSWYLARSYLSFGKGEYAITTMALISFTSIAIGSFALALVTAVMNGFQTSIHEKMQNIHPSATIYSYKDPISFVPLKKAIAQKFPEVTAVSPYAIGHVMVQSNAMEQDELPAVVQLKAFDPHAESQTTSLSKKMIHGSLDDVGENKVIIGKTLANTLEAQIGDPITIIYIEQPSGKQRSVPVHQKESIIGGIFETGIDEYDNGTIFSSFNFFNELFPDHGITQIGIAIDPNAETQSLIISLRQFLNLEVLTWKDLYLPLVSALILEKYAMFLILLLITLVASMNIIALLFMMITHKRSDIAILRAMGLKQSTITHSFILLGLTISAAACICGLAAACAASWILEKYPFIKLPDVYYVSHLPARMEWSILIIVFILVMCITALASWFSVRQIRSINIANVLRFEG
jgi:lipoprotein-releasing system permease protein